MEKKRNKIFNPFEGRDRDRVWKEIRESAVPITREEAFRPDAGACRAEEEKEVTDVYC